MPVELNPDEIEPVGPQGYQVWPHAPRRATDNPDVDEVPIQPINLRPILVALTAMGVVALALFIIFRATFSAPEVKTDIGISLRNGSGTPGVISAAGGFSCATKRAPACPGETVTVMIGGGEPIQSHLGATTLPLKSNDGALALFGKHHPKDAKAFTGNVPNGDVTQYLTVTISCHPGAEVTVGFALTSGGKTSTEVDSIGCPS